MSLLQAQYLVYINADHYLQNIPQATNRDGILKRRGAALEAFKKDVEEFAKGRDGDQQIQIDCVLLQGILMVTCSPASATELEKLPGVSNVRLDD